MGPGLARVRALPGGLRPAGGQCSVEGSRARRLGLLHEQGTPERAARRGLEGLPEAEGAPRPALARLVGGGSAPDRLLYHRHGDLDTSSIVEFPFRYYPCFFEIMQYNKLYKSYKSYNEKDNHLEDTKR